MALQLVSWFALGTIALAVLSFGYFAFKATTLRLNPYFFRGRLLCVIGIGFCGLGLYLTVQHHNATHGHGVSWIALGVLAVGVMLWVVGEIWERAARKHVKFVQGLIDIAQESQKRMDRNGEESSPT